MYLKMYRPALISSFGCGSGSLGKLDSNFSKASLTQTSATKSNSTPQIQSSNLGDASRMNFPTSVATGSPAEAKALPPNGLREDILKHLYKTTLKSN